MPKQNTHGWPFKLALLSLSILAMTAPSIAIANPLMAKTFTAQTTAQVEMIATLPNLGVLLLIMFSTWIAQKLGVKRTIMLGLFLYLIGGLMPVLISNYVIIILARFIMGCGIGLFNPFSVSLMYNFYQDQELADMLGYQNTAQNLGNAGFGLLLSLLVLAGWKTVFTGYLIALIPLLLFGLLVKIPTPKVTVKATRPKQTTNGHVLVLAGLMLIIFGLFMMMTIKLASFVTTQQLTTPAMASTILAVMGAASMIASAIFGKLSHYLGNYMLPVALIGIAMGFLIVATANSVTLIFVGVIIAGGFFGWVFPQGFLRVAQIAPAHSENLSTSIMLMGINLGAFLSPTLVNGAANLLGNDQPAFVLTMCGWGFVTLAVGTSLYTLIDNRRQTKLHA
ncbi:MFS transporter [Lactobacillus sp. CBA3606]|uniref:MFS transporter n=1 Tax=Lactobacillus sp. CBA3606 TaxID=2099789 RepID=UPI000CFB97C4|nr:MFS transporter [Lactobacillus sp. CBA3606]AVK64289.1 MFS transporter [Lactobacillus sp. CBA3606]